MKIWINWLIWTLKDIIVSSMIYKFTPYLALFSQVVGNQDQVKCRQKWGSASKYNPGFLTPWSPTNLTRIDREDFVCFQNAQVKVIIWLQYWLISTLNRWVHCRLILLFFFTMNNFLSYIFSGNTRSLVHGKICRFDHQPSSISVLGAKAAEYTKLQYFPHSEIH